MPAQFHEHGGHILRGKRGQMAANRGGARKRDKPNSVVPNEVIRNGRRMAEHKIKYAGRQARIFKRARNV